MKTIIHIDLDAFFASVESAINKKLKGKPIVVCGLNKRGVVCSASYEARQFGVKAAMPYFMAKNKCPKAIFVEPHFDKYLLFSQHFTEIVTANFSNIVEKFSIDEIYVDITRIAQTEQQAIRVCQQIQQMVKRKLDITCSIGISNNKFLAKMASDMKKPNGITTLFKSEIDKKLWTLPIGKMLWVGESTSKTLQQIGINSIGELANKKNEELILKVLNKSAQTLIDLARGEGSDEIDQSFHLPKSISHAETLDLDTNDKLFITEQARNHLLLVITELNTYHLLAKTVTLTIKYQDFQQITRSKSFKQPTNKLDQIWETVEELINQSIKDKKIRMVGVGLSNFIFCSGWSIERLTKQTTDQKFIKKINDTIGKNLLFLASDKLR